MKKTFCLFSLAVGLFCCLGSLEAAEVLWQADFSQDGPLNWRSIHINKRDRFEVKNNELIVTGVAAPYLGSRYIIDLPDLDRGALCFEVNPNSAKASGAYSRNGFSLMVRLNDVVTAFGISSWFRYREHSPQKQVHMYNDPPFGQYYPCKIEFDKTAGTLRYYLKDMVTPVFVEDNVAFPDKNTLIVGNYGLCSGTVENRLRNLRLEKMDGSGSGSVRTFVLHGFASGSYQLDRLTGALSTSPVVNYYVKPIVNVLCVNKFTLDRMPDFSMLSAGSLVVLADIPLNCAKLDQAALLHLEAAVRNGTTLIVLGGMFTLNKGCFAGTPLEALMPVTIAQPFSMHTFPAMPEFPGAAKSAFYMTHGGNIKPQAQVFAQHNQIPLLVGWKYGKGQVVVSMVVPAGDIPDGRYFCGQTNQFTDKIVKSVNALK